MARGGQDAPQRTPGGAAIQAGFDAYFINRTTWWRDLMRATRKNRLHRRMRVYLVPKLLVIDEMGYLPLDGKRSTVTVWTAVI